MHVSYWVVLFLGVCGQVCAQGEVEGPGFDGAVTQIRKDLARGLEDLSALRREIAAEKIPLSKQLSQLEAELQKARVRFQEVSRSVDTSTQDLDNLRSRIKGQKDEASYLSNLLSEYIRNFEAQLHVAELQRYGKTVQEARLAADNGQIEAQEVAAQHARVLEMSLDRLFELGGGTLFSGQAVAAGSTGMVADGKFAMIGPAVLFRATAGEVVGTAEQLNSLEPQVLEFKDPATASAANDLISKGVGLFPFDATLGRAHAVARSEDSLVDEFHKGGTVMYPIVGMATLALLIACYRWLVLSLQRRPSRRGFKVLLAAVAGGQVDEAQQVAGKLSGPTGKMLRVGAAHLGEPKELIEEAMYENVLTTRQHLQKMLPFIAICAASAPLLGLLGTVNGIINTFKMITISGSDIENLSSGISEALITTKYGLIVAIPALLLNAYLSRKAKAIASQMETSALAFLNAVARNSALPAYPSGQPDRQGQDTEVGVLVRDQVQSILKEMLAPLGSGGVGLNSRGSSDQAVG